uniref:Uncharacterized protein n=1 Tax=Panagrolaimus sp. ES5 TaxID=591445 RepID=A0AC34FKL4_9BILA
MMQSLLSFKNYSVASILAQQAAVAALGRASLGSPMDSNSMLQQLTLNALLESNGAINQQPHQLHQHNLHTPVASVSLPASATTNVFENPLSAELQRLQILNMYLCQQNAFQQLFDQQAQQQQHQQQQQQQQQSSTSTLLSQLLMLARAKEVQQQQQSTVQQPNPMDILHLLQAQQQQVQVQAPPQMDIASLLAAMANSQQQQQQQHNNISTSPSLTSSSTSASTTTTTMHPPTTLSLEQQLLSFSNAASSSPSASKDNLCVI